MKVNFGLTAKDYSKYRAGYPDELYKRLLKYNIGLENQSILDLGTGTGYLARQFAIQGARVTGIDIAPELIKEAEKLDKKYNIKINYEVCKAENLPFSSSTFDVVSAGQCWHWFDTSKVIKEVRRVLKPDGKLLICHFDWIPINDNVVAKTEDLILKYNPSWQGARGTGIYPQWLTGVGSGGFSNIETFTFDVAVEYTHEAWRGRIRASAGVGASLPAERVKEFDRDLAELLNKNYEDPIFVPHRVFCLICVNKKA
ncbi:SAM-dependent methyltransferase [Neobacillus thermocopriae]|jgi:SAM-dependent methyltransferase|nr:SAM-dependent methyltransferase [Neobacillus thermocopriae]